MIKLTILLILTLLISCRAIKKNNNDNVRNYPMPENSEINETIEEDSLVFRFWLLTELRDSTLQFKSEDGKYRYIHFFDGKITGSTKEQRFSAKYSLDSNRINIYKIKTDDKIRPTDLITTEYFQMFIDSKKFNMISDTLFLFDSTNKVISKYLRIG